MHPPSLLPITTNNNDKEDDVHVCGQSLCDCDAGQILLCFLQHHTKFSMPTKNIICSPENAAALLPEAHALVDPVEPG